MKIRNMFQTSKLVSKLVKEIFRREKIGENIVDSRYVTLNSMSYFKYPQLTIFHVWMSRRVRTKFGSKGSLY